MPSTTISTTATELLPRNRFRRSFVVQNENDVINVYIKREPPGSNTVSTTNHDHRLGPGGSLALNWGNDGKEAIQDRWTIIAESGTPRISFFETEDVVR